MYVACSTNCFARYPLERSLRLIGELEFSKLKQSAFCYKCIHRLINANLLILKVKSLRSKFKAIAGEVQSDIKKQTEIEERGNHGNNTNANLIWRRSLAKREFKRYLIT